MAEPLLERLAAPFSPDIVSWRVGSTNKDKTKGMALAYLDSRDIQDRLNAVCGTDWQVRHPWAAGTKLACEIGIKIDGEWIWRGDGAGDSDVEAEKGAFSDSFKRAAVRWGIGRYLYDVDSPWVIIEAYGKSYKIADSERVKLRNLLAKSAKMPAQAAPATEPAPSTPDPFFKAASYEISPKTIGTWSKWESAYRARAAMCKTIQQFGKLEKDNADNTMNFSLKANPVVVEALRVYMNEIAERLRQADTATSFAA